MRGEVTKYLFIDSSVQHGRVSLPPQPFSCAGNDQMSFTLLDFQMRRSFPVINNSNNTFYIYVVSTQTFYQVQLPYGDYDGFEDIAQGMTDAITKTLGENASLQQVLSGIDVEYVQAARVYKFTISMQGQASPEDVEIRCFHVKDGAVPSGVQPVGAYSDSFEILGAEPIIDGAADKNSLLRDVDTSILYSHFPPVLSTLDSIYLRMNLELGNYESPGLDVYHRDGVQMQNSSIIARFPVADAGIKIRKGHEQIRYTDLGGDQYQKMLPLKNLEHIQFFVTDKRNRSLALYDEAQSRLGLMSFSLTLRWDKFIQPSKDINQIPTRPPPTPFLPSYGYNMPRI